MNLASVRSEGGLLPPDLLEKVAAEEIAGQRAADFGLRAGERLSEEIAAAWSDA